MLYVVCKNTPQQFLSVFVSLTFCFRSRSQYEGANFVLQTTFPNRELTNESETIESAKLQNAVVVQRMKWNVFTSYNCSGFLIKESCRLCPAAWFCYQAVSKIAESHFEHCNTWMSVWCSYMDVWNGCYGIKTDFF